MPVMINDDKYYRTAEVCRLVGISRNTLFRWFKAGLLKEKIHRDRRGWRLFTENQVEALKNESNRIIYPQLYSNIQQEFNNGTS